MWGYCDADWGGDPDSFKSTGGYVCFLNGGAISWKSKRQQTITLSSAEAEFMAASRMAQEVVYLRHLLSQFGYVQELPTVVYKDNKAAISILSEKRFKMGIWFSLSAKANIMWLISLRKVFRKQFFNFSVGS